MITSDSIANLTLALSIVQGKMSHAVKDLLRMVLAPLS